LVGNSVLRRRRHCRRWLNHGYATRNRGKCDCPAGHDEKDCASEAFRHDRCGCQNPAALAQLSAAFAPHPLAFAPLSRAFAPLSRAFAPLSRAFAPLSARSRCIRWGHAYIDPRSRSSGTVLENRMGTPIVRLPLILLGTVAYFGLAVLGLGGLTAFFSHPALVALTIALFIMAGVSVFAGGNLSAGVREDRGNRWVLAGFGVLGLLDVYLPAWTDRMELWTIDGDTVRWLGVVLFAVGGGLRIWPVFVLGDRFSGLVAIQPGHTLVTTGIFGVIRNPSYLGMLLNALGWGLAFRSGVGMSLAVLFIPPLVARIRSEEGLLRAQFGAEYAAYFARTSRLVPGLW
jgi:protein-S-isoprenylcysteine O-methyltransferase Ste14